MTCNKQLKIFKQTQLKVNSYIFNPTTKKIKAKSIKIQSSHKMINPESKNLKTQLKEKKAFTQNNYSQIKAFR